MATNANNTFTLSEAYTLWSHLINYNFSLGSTQADVDAALTNTVLIANMPSTDFNKLLSFVGAEGSHPSLVALADAYNSSVLAAPSADALMTANVTLNNTATVINNPIGWYSYEDIGALSFITLAPVYHTNPSGSYAGNVVAQHSITTDSSIATISYAVGKAGSDLVTAIVSVDTATGAYTALQTGADVVFSGTPLTGSEGFTSDPTIHIHVGVGVIETFVAGTSVTDNVFISVFKA